MPSNSNNKESQSNTSPKKDEVSIQNPRKAATKTKEAHNNMDMMKRRLLVLQGQEDYNRYKTLDH